MLPRNFECVDCFVSFGPRAAKKIGTFDGKNRLFSRLNGEKEQVVAACVVAKDPDGDQITGLHVGELD